MTTSETKPTSKRQARIAKAKARSVEETKVLRQQERAKPVSAFRRFTPSR